MPPLRRARGSRSERWYSVWDVLWLAYLPGKTVGNLGASLNSRRRWARWDRLVWYYPLGVKRVSWCWPLTAIGVASVALAYTWPQSPLAAALAAAAMLILAVIVVRIQTPLLVVARRARCRMLNKTAELPSDNRVLAAESMGKLIESRRYLWTQTLPGTGTMFHLHIYDPWCGAALLFAPFALLVTEVVFRSLGDDRSSFICWALFVFFLSTSFPSLRCDLLLKKARRRAQRGACPDCGYDLCSLPNGIGPSHLGGVHSGPATCPECGAAWPMIPPPRLPE